MMCAPSPTFSPAELSQILIDLFDRLLDRNAATRWTARQLKRHPFFDGIDWDAVAAMEDEPPFEPSVNLGALLEGKDDIVTDAQAEQEAHQPLSDFDQELFSEWDFIDQVPLLLLRLLLTPLGKQPQVRRGCRR